MGSTLKTDVLRVVLPVFLILLLLIAIVSWEIQRDSGLDPPFYSYRIINLQFIDGGTGVDRILATVKSEREAINITSGYVNGNATGISGTLTIPEGETGTVLLTLPSGTLVAGREYRVELKIDRKDAIPLFADERYFFYHMYHPDTPGPVEEGVITELFPGYYSRYTPDADWMTCTVQNTGDFAITITGGFINGWAARNTTGDLTIEKGAHQQVTMYFPPASLVDQMLNRVPFQVKLVTARDNIIAYAEPQYIPWKDDGNTPEPVIIQEQGEISTVQFVDGGTSNDLIIATVKNTGSNSINIKSCLVNGKESYFLSGTVVIPEDGTAEVTIPRYAGTFAGSEKYQVVLITSNNNAFVCTSTYQ